MVGTPPFFTVKSTFRFKGLTLTSPNTLLSFQKQLSLCLTTSFRLAFRMVSFGAEASLKVSSLKQAALCGRLTLVYKLVSLIISLSCFSTIKLPVSSLYLFGEGR